VPGNRTTTAGTVKVTNGSTTVEGIGTSFLVGKHEKFGQVRTEKCGTHDYGAWFAIPEDNQAYSPSGKPYDIDEFVSNTEITLKEPYSGETYQTGDLEYVISSVMFYGHGGNGVSNYPNCYRGLDFEEANDTHLNWPDWVNFYIGGKGCGSFTRTTQQGLSW